MRTSALAVLIALALYAASAAQTGRSMFVYQNNFWVNLHEFLRGEIYRRGAKLTPGIDPASLSDSERQAWDVATEVYAEVSKHDQIADADARRISNTLSALGDATSLRDGLLDDGTTQALNTAAPIYRARLWASRQRDNEAWNARAKALTDGHQAAMSAALAKVYEITWPREPYLVDAVGETGANSAFTHAPPSPDFAAHIHASVGSVRNTGDAPLELMFHEASHVGAIAGPITQMIVEASERQNLPVNRDLWHFVIMFTTGEVARRELERTGSPGYVPYVYRYNQLPAPALSAFERHWLPHLDGKTSLRQALTDLVRDVR